MSPWILILTVFYAGESAHTTAIEFTSRERCNTAAAAWLAPFRRHDTTFPDLRPPVAVCVPK